MEQELLCFKEEGIYVRTAWDSTYKWGRLWEPPPVAAYVESHVILDERLTKMYDMSSTYCSLRNKIPFRGLTQYSDTYKAGNH
jgi:hypothetical protein